MSARVLLIDDSRFLRTALEKTLTAKGFEVRVAGDGEEGLRLAQEEKFDLILLDLFLPKLTGYEVLKRLKDNPETDTVPVLVLSGVAKPKEMEELMNIERYSHVQHLVTSLRSRLRDGLERHWGVP